MSTNIFQAGRIYRTVNGELMKLESIGGGMFAGKSQGDPLKVDRWQIIYNRAGVPTDSTKASWILLPGTVDPREIHDKPESEHVAKYRAEHDGRIPGDPLSPRFEPGKTYRTKAGRTAQVLNDHGAHMTQPYCLSVNGNTVWAFGDGSFNDDLMLPGALEDEPRDETDLCIWRFGIAAALQDQAERMKELEAELRAAKTAGKDQYLETSRQLRVIRGRLGEIEGKDKVGEAPREWQKRLANLESALTGVSGVQGRLKGIEAWTEAQAATNRTTTENQGQFDLRINDLWKALDKVRTDMETSNTVNRLTAGAAKRLDDIEAAIGIIDNRQDQFGKQALRQRGDVNDLSNRLDELEKARAWIDTFDIKRWCDIINERLDGLVLEHAEKARVPSDRIIPRGTFMSLLNALGYEIGEYGRVRKKAVDPRLVQGQLVDSAAWTGRRKIPKPTIKGGWVNVYAGRWLSGIHSTETDAKLSNDGQGRNRIACIQIPDFTEGEGL